MRYILPTPSMPPSCRKTQLGMPYQSIHTDIIMYYIHKNKVHNWDVIGIKYALHTCNAAGKSISLWPYQHSNIMHIKLDFLLVIKVLDPNRKAWTNYHKQ